MNAYLFPVSSVLRHFAAAGRLEALRSLLGGRGRWTAATAFEAGWLSSGNMDLESAAGWLGEPLEISDPAEIRHVQLLRRAVFGGATDDPLSRLGDAETWHVLSEWPSFADGIVVTDDPLLLHFANRRGMRAQRASVVDLSSGR